MKSSQVKIIVKPCEKNNVIINVPDEKEKTRIAAYCRVSTAIEHQVDSLEIQKMYFTKLIRNTSGWELVGIYSDSVTGTDRTKRSGFQRMIRHCEEGKIDRILCKSISRFGRNTAEMLDVVNMLKEKNIGVSFEKGNIDTLSLRDEFIISTLAAMAQEEIRSASENMAWSYKRRFQQGKPHFQRILGYNVETSDGKYVISIIEEEADIVREIYDLAIQGLGILDIVRTLSSKGYRTKKGSQNWTRETVKNTLRNERYTGDVLCQKTYKDNYLTHELKVNKGELPQYLIKDHHPAIISHEVFEKVQGILATNKKAGTSLKKRQIHLFPKRLICGECGASLVIHGHCKDRRWKCGNSIRNNIICNAIAVKESAIKGIMLEAFKQRYAGSDRTIIHSIKLDLRRINDNDNFEKHRMNLSNKLSTLQKIIKCFAGNEKEVAKSHYKEIQDDLKNKEVYWRFVEEDCHIRKKVLEWLESINLNDNNSETFFQKLEIDHMRAMITSIIVHSKGTFKIRWADDLESEIYMNCGSEINKITSKAEIKHKPLKVNSFSDSLLSQTQIFKDAIKVKPNEPADSYSPKSFSIPALGNDTGNISCQQIKRIAAYCRISSKDNHQLSSFKLQINYFTNLILKNTSWRFSGIYADEGTSGTSTKQRKNFLRMIEDCKAGKIDMILVKSVSRYSRNIVECLSYIRMLKSLPKPVGVYFEKENINSLDEKSEFLLSIFGGIAQDESRCISEGILWGIEKRFESGIANRTFSILGYHRDEIGNLNINHEEAIIVRRIYKDFLLGITASQIARDLTNEGVKPYRGQAKWYYSTVLCVLENEKYCGDVLLQKYFSSNFLEQKKINNQGQKAQYYIEGHHEAIISKEEWQEVQNEIKRRRTWKQHDHNLSDCGNVFTKKIVCGVCGEYFQINRQTFIRNEKKYHYTKWTCRSRKERNNGVKCDSKIYSQEDIEKAFASMLQDLKDNQKELIEEVNEVIRKLDFTELEIKKMSELKSELNLLYKKLSQGELARVDDSAEWIDPVAQFLKENKRLQNELEELDSRLKKQMSIMKGLKWFLNELNELDDINNSICDLEFRDIIFESMVERCLIFEDGVIKFELNLGISRNG